jgi:hypothetical protein
MMIPDTHWHDNGDGTAWVVATDPRDVWGVDEVADRPCDTCDGEGYEWDDDDGSYDCPDCDCTGRHTFEVEVDRRRVLNNEPACGAPKDSRWGYLPCGCSHDGMGNHVRRLLPRESFVATHRVHIVPDMVLPIDLTLKRGYPRTFERFAYVSKTGALRVVDHNAQTDTYIGRAPAGAKKDTWAILLRILS